MGNMLNLKQWRYGYAHNLMGTLAQFVYIRLMDALLIKKVTKLYLDMVYTTSFLVVGPKYASCNIWNK